MSSDPINDDEKPTWFEKLQERIEEIVEPKPDQKALPVPECGSDGAAGIFLGTENTT